MSKNLIKDLSRLMRTHTARNHRASSARKSSRARGTLRLVIENLEVRVVPAYPLVADVLSGTVSTTVGGTVCEDLDSNGVKSGGENGVKGWIVYLDLDQSGTLNTDANGTPEPSAVTNVDGDFQINHLKPGTYRLAEVVPSGWKPTSPASQDVVVIKDKDTKADFFNFSGGDIVGTVWNDLNADGARATDPGTGAFSEPGLAGWTVFLDGNNNRAVDPGEPTTLTDANGGYSFTNLPPGDYEVTEVLPAGWNVSPLFDTRQTATVVARTQVSQDFANYSLLDGSIQGTIWNDLNANGVRNTDPATGAYTEPGLEDWTVFLDLNKNGLADASEPTALTNAAGDYSFISVAAGDYEVTEILPADWNVSPTFDTKQTVNVRSGKAAVSGDFANFTVLNGSIRGAIWNDLNRNGSRDATLAGAFTDPGLANWPVFLDLNHNRVADPGEPSTLTDADGGYAFPGLQVGDYAVREILPSGWETAPGFDDNATVTVYSGTVSVAPDFANFNLSTAIPGSIAGTVWNDLNGNGVRDADPATGAFTDPGLAGRRVFADLNSNGLFDAAEPNAISGTDGSYTLSGINPGSVTVIEEPKAGWRATSPATGLLTIALKNGENAGGFDFGNWTLQDAAIRGTIFADTNKNGVRDPGERGLDGLTVYLDLNNNNSPDAGEPRTTTSADQFYTPAVDETGTYEFTHLAAGTYVVRAVMPAVLGATPAAQLEHTVTISATESHPGVDTAAVFRPAEIHGVKFDDSNGNHQRDAGEAGVAGVTVFADLNRNNAADPGEPTTVTASDGSYSFTDLAPGAYVIREVLPAGEQTTYPTTVGGILWPSGTSNPAVGNVTPTSITASLKQCESNRRTVSITLPNTGALTNLVDVFLLFDDTGSFVNNSPIVRSAFPSIISQLQATMPGIDLGFGVGRFEEYGNFAYEYNTGRPFVLNQPIVAASSGGYLSAIQAALDRTTPGYGGDQPETDIEALYQLVTGKGFDGNNNGSTLDSGSAGLVSTQLNPGGSGDVPSFASFMADAGGNVMPAAGNVGGAGFRSGALPIVLVATDTGFAYQPKGETSVTGVGGASLPISSFTQTSRPTTPYDSGAGIQETITGLNALGALVIGLGTNTETNLDPRQGLESISKLTGAVNRSSAPIDNGTATPIAPGDPLYFQISSGFAGSVSNGVVNAIQNAVTNVAVDVTVQASDPRVKIINHSGVRAGIGSGQTASFDIEFVGDGVPHRFDLQFVRTGTNVVLGSIPVVLGTPVPGDGYEFEDLSEGEIHTGADFGSHQSSTTTVTPSLAVTGGTFAYDGTAHAASAAATDAGGATVAGSFTFTYNGSATVPKDAGVYSVVASFTSADANYSNATGITTLTITPATPAVTATGGDFGFDGLPHAAAATATGLAGATVGGAISLTYNGSSTVPTSAGVYDVVASFVSEDSNYSNATAHATLTITAASPTILVTGGPFVFDGTAHGMAAAATGVGGTTIAGTFAITYDGSATVPVNAGTYAVAVTFSSTDGNYSNGSASGSLVIGKATPAFTLVNSPVISAGTASVAVSGRLAAGPVFPTGETVDVILNGVSQSVAVDGSGNFTTTFASAGLKAGTYPITLKYAGDGTNFNASADGASALTVNAVTGTIDATGLDFRAVAGTPLSRPVARFKNALGGASAYAAKIEWGDGGSSAGVITGSGSKLSVLGSHTYAEPGTFAVRVTIIDKRGLGLFATTNGTAIVTDLGLAAGKTKQAEFWQSRQGRQLLLSFNGGAARQDLANWLSANFPRLYGANAGMFDLTGRSNYDVALLLANLWRTGGDGAATQVLTTALNVYATTASLGGAAAASYGFTVSTTGLGARSFDVGLLGIAVGVPDKTKLNVCEMLHRVDAQAKLGVLYNGNLSLQHTAKTLFDKLNSI